MKGAKKGHPKWGGRQKGTKNRDTLIKEERRAIFDAQVSQTWEDTIKKLRPEYVADQFLGKATEKIEVEGNLELDIDIKKIIDKVYGHKDDKSD